MIHILRGTDLWMHPYLAKTMFLDRKQQFFDRLRWPVSVDKHGYERDEYDSENPIYIIVSDVAGRHAGSLRLLPLGGKTMVFDHFQKLLKSDNFDHQNTWECTRLCVAQNQKKEIASTLLACGAFIMNAAELKHLIGVFDWRMLRLYKRLGAEPKAAYSIRYPSGRVGIGYWVFERMRYEKLIEIGKVSTEEIEKAMPSTFPWRNILPHSS